MPYRDLMRQIQEDKANVACELHTLRSEVALCAVELERGALAIAHNARKLITTVTGINPHGQPC